MMMALLCAARQIRCRKTRHSHSTPLRPRTRLRCCRAASALSRGPTTTKQLDFLDDLDDVLVLEHVLLADALRPVLAAGAPHQSVLELLQNALVDAVAEVLHRVPVLGEHDGVVVVRQLALGLGVDAQQAEVVPAHLDQAVQVPLEVRAHGAVVRQLVQHVELLQRDLVHLVDGVDAGDVDAAALNHVHQLVHGAVLLEEDVCVVYAVLRAHRLHGVQVQLRVRHVGGERQAALVLFLERQPRQLLVQPDAKALELVLDELLVRHGLQAVQHDDDQVARARGGDDLPAAALAVLGALDDSRQVQQLDLGASVADDTRDTCERGELVRRHLGECPRELVQQSGFADRGEAYEPHPRVAHFVHIKAFALPAAARARPSRGLQQLPAQLGQLGLQHAEMARRGLVLLCPGHLILNLLDLL
mmetsp:Transcript_12153/g.30665  ORF Transcript_12153/g.30665 Transcript_12153/m.30665 type:complete len:417 (+) Transcript_12153:144-1394(+)